MVRNLLIVESPAKAKTLSKYLGKTFQVLASYGHVRDLSPKADAVDVHRDFKMHYEAVDKNKPHVLAIANALKKSDNLYLATDPDREGEAIAWHLYELLKEAKVAQKKTVYRVVFNQITKQAVQFAIDHPRDISEDYVDAYKARRVLDRLYGFTVSPVLWEKIMWGLSAGRVQSPALRMIVERESEIKAFKPQEYWSVLASVKKQDKVFQARLVVYQGEKLSQFSIVDAKQAKAVEKVLLEAADGKLVVDKIEKKQTKRNPPPPFITSTLQQEAAQKLGFSASKTMRIAQQLYEGLETAQGSVGLITYMRTDSNRIAPEALTMIRSTITQVYGEAFLPDHPRMYKTKAKNAQEAHEAIRPTSSDHKPDEVERYLNKDQAKLYRLIWQRTMACQMLHATINTVAVDFRVGTADHYFRANGSSIANPGFLSVYSAADQMETQGALDKYLPEMKAGDVLPLEGLETQQHFTQPPPRYSEATLIKTLEEYGIGRPSTYAIILSTLQERNYTVLDNRRFHPTDVGVVVNEFLTKHFKQYVDYGFTADMENTLDAISRGEAAWVKEMHHFWTPFKEQVEDVRASTDRSDVVQQAIEEACPECGEPLSIRLGRRGRFIGCTRYPDCRYTRSLGEEEEKNESEVLKDRFCPKCNKPLIIKVGRYGKFIGCEGYPDCKHVEPLEKPEDTGVVCPDCSKANLMKRRSRRGTYFYGCSGYPKCRYVVWGKPLNKGCPKCHFPVTVVKITKKSGTERICPQKTCDFKEAYEDTE